MSPALGEPRFLVRRRPAHAGHVVAILPLGTEGRLPCGEIRWYFRLVGRRLVPSFTAPSNLSDDDFGDAEAPVRSIASASSLPPPAGVLA